MCEREQYTHMASIVLEVYSHNFSYEPNPKKSLNVPLNMVVSGKLGGNMRMKNATRRAHESFQGVAQARGFCVH